MTVIYIYRVPGTMPGTSTAWCLPVAQTTLWSRCWRGPRDSSYRVQELGLNSSHLGSGLRAAEPRAEAPIAAASLPTWALELDARRSSAALLAGESGLGPTASQTRWKEPEQISEDKADSAFFFTMQPYVLWQ